MKKRELLRRSVFGALQENIFLSICTSFLRPWTLNPPFFSWSILVGSLPIFIPQLISVFLEKRNTPRSVFFARSRIYAEFFVVGNYINQENLGDKMPRAASRNCIFGLIFVIRDRCIKISEKRGFTARKALASRSVHLVGSVGRGLSLSTTKQCVYCYG